MHIQTFQPMATQLPFSLIVGYRCHMMPSTKLIHLNALAIIAAPFFANIGILA